MDAAWKPLEEVLDGTVPTVGLVTEVLEQHRAFRLQRVAAYALVVRGDQVLLVRNSPRGPYPGGWTLPGRRHRPRRVARGRPWSARCAEETGLAVHRRATSST